MAFFRLLNNWKTVLGYVLMSVPQLTDYPMLLDAAQKLLANASTQNIVNFVVQILLAAGVGHRVLKNLKIVG